MDDSPTTEGTADERKEAIASTGKEPAPICEGISHSAVLQAGPRGDCEPAKETSMGRSSFALGNAADGMERWG
jgi:hypothetical protein